MIMEAAKSKSQSAGGRPEMQGGAAESKAATGRGPSCSGEHMHGRGRRGGGGGGRRVSVFVLFRPSTNWIRRTHLRTVICFPQSPQI